MNTGYMVYWTDNLAGSCSRLFSEAEMSEALRFMNEDLRKRDTTSFVTFVAELSNQVGKSGVDTVRDGKTPDGHDYTWSKADRAGRTKRGSELIPARNGADL